MYGKTVRSEVADLISDVANDSYNAGARRFRASHLTFSFNICEMEEGRALQNKYGAIKYDDLLIPNSGMRKTTNCYQM